MTSATRSAPDSAALIDGPYAWRRLAASLGLGTIGSVGFWGVVVILPAVQAEFAIDRADASIPYSLTMAGFGIGNVLIGRVVDRLGIVRPVIAAALTLGLGFIGAAFATSIWQFALFQGLLIGVGTASTFGPLIADVSHWFRRRRGIAVATCASGNYVGGALWPLAMEVVTSGYGWRTTYIAIGCVCIATMVPLALTLRRPPPKEDPDATAAALAQAPGRPRVAQDRSIALSQRALLILLSIAGIGCCVATSMPQVHIVAYCGDLGYGTERGAEMLSLMLAAGAVSRVVSGGIADYIGGVRMLLIGSSLQALSLVFYLPFDGLMSLYVISSLFGLAQGGIVPCYAIIVREYMPARVAAERVGIVIMMTLVGMSFGGWVSGWIFDRTGSYHTAFVNGIAWNLLNIAIMSFILWRTRLPRAPVLSA